jgi:predicted type IV restriction endonuclease
MADVPAKIRELVESFERHIETYQSQQYNEAQLRREFIDPFFEELGWDIINKQAFAPQYREVIHEDAIKISGETKAPDYCFRIGGVRKFFLEAKKPSVNIDTDPDPAYQLRRYAWSAKLPLSILTNFETFAVYDCQIRPQHTDRPSVARIIELNYREFPDKWDEIAGVFSKDAILKGSFDKYAISTKGKRGTTTVDSEFLAEIEKWREMLAKVVTLRNRFLSISEINFAIQQIIDRILFLRLCEDRGIEPYGQLRAISSGDRNYARLCEIFEKADQRYNSGLFYFSQETGRPEKPDELTPKLAIDDKDLKWILHSLYYPQSPYEFSVLPAEILGNVYEQFLGKVIRLTTGRRAIVEEKPEVKKAGGVYYTPAYIVDYIVKNTVGKLCEDKTPKQIEKLKILDPACGSGSFLLGAYTYLLNYHLDWYVKNEPLNWLKKKNPPIYQVAAGAGAEQESVIASEAKQSSNFRLTIAEKKRILLNNIYGVDIDYQAVEVTKLSLLLKVLEGENFQTLENQYRLFHERALPDLADNIKCGNSLIGPDFYDTIEPESISDELQQKINAFDWQSEFSGIFSGNNPGFDAVIGNPPYVRIQTMQENQQEALSYFTKKYKSALKGNYDIYVIFVEKGLSLLNLNGQIGFILPHKFFNAQYGRPLRKLLSQGKNLSHVVHFGHQQVFERATTYTCLLFLQSCPQKEFIFVKVDDLSDWIETQNAKKGIISSKKVNEQEWNFVVGDGYRLFNKLAKRQPKLGDIADIFVGLQTSADDVFIMNFVNKTTKNICLKSKSLDCELNFEKDLLFPLVSGTDVKRYTCLPERQYILFPYHIDDQHVELIPIKTITKKYPKTAEYFMKNKKILEERERGQFKDLEWHRFGRSQNIGIQGRIKLCVPRLVYNLHAAYDENGNHFLDNVDVGGITLKPDCIRQNLKYLLALLNSSLLRWYFPFISAPFRGGWFSANRQFLSQLPIRIIDFDDSDDKSKHNKIVTFVDRMLELHKKLAAAKIPNEKTRIERQIDTTDKQIDNLVYDLYGLTDEEIKIVEGNT